MVTRQGYGLGIGGCKRLCPVAMGHSLVTLLSLSVSVKDRPLYKTLGKSQTYYPEHILGYGRLEDLLLSCHEFWLFSDRLSECFFGYWRSLHCIEFGTRGRGLGVLVWTGT